jgi:hypothetical protein
MRSTGRRPRERHLTLQAAQEEAKRLAAGNPLAEVWVLECRTVETHRAEVAEAPSDSAATP